MKDKYGITSHTDDCSDDDCLGECVNYEDNYLRSMYEEYIGTLGEVFEDE